MTRPLLTVTLCLSTFVGSRMSHAENVQADSFLRGDFTGDTVVDLTDAIRTLTVMFLGGEPPSCGDAADSDDDGQVGISDPLYTLYFLFLNGPPPPRPFPSRGKDPTRDELPCASDAGLVWIPAPTPLAYDLTFMHRADGVIYETEEESVTFDFQHSEKVLAQGDSFARFGQRFDFDPLRLIVPNEDNSWAPGSALWFVLPGGNANPEPGVTMQTVYPEELEPGVVVIQDVADYTIQSVSGHTIEFTVIRSLRIAQTVGFDDLLGNLFGPAGGLETDVPVALCEVVYDRDLGAISSMDCGFVQFPPETEWTIQDLEKYPGRSTAVIRRR